MYELKKRMPYYIAIGKGEKNEIYFILSFILYSKENMRRKISEFKVQLKVGENGEIEKERKFLIETLFKRDFSETKYPKDFLEEKVQIIKTEFENFISIYKNKEEIINLNLLLKKHDIWDLNFYDDFKEKIIDEGFIQSFCLNEEKSFENKFPIYERRILYPKEKIVLNKIYKEKEFGYEKIVCKIYEDKEECFFEISAIFKNSKRISEVIHAPRIKINERMEELFKNSKKFKLKFLLNRNYNEKNI